MGEPKDDERDEEWFKEVYGQGYTGPIRSTNEISHDKSSVKKRSMTEASDEDESPPDPNAVPTDFTSREAKVWESKAKAIERNWKKKKEEELICRICGEYGHFSQGCPSTLGANLKQQREIVEKIPVKDKRLKPRIIGTGGSVIQGIEKDTGCRLKLEDNLASGSASFFVRISGSSRGMVGKAVDAVKKLLDQVQHERKPQGSQRSHGSHNRGSSMNSVGNVQIQHMPNQPSRHEQSYPGQDLPYYGDGQYGGMEQINQVDSRRQWEGGNQNGSFAMASYGHKGGEDHVAEVDVGYTDQQPITSTIETLEHKFVQETMQLTKELNDAEDKENARHREAMREIQEQYQQKMVTLRSQQAKRREEFLRQDAHFRQQKYQQYPPNAPPQSGPKYYDYDSSGGFGNNNRDKLGYGNLVDRNDGVITTGGSYDSYRGEGGYHNSSRSYRSSGYDAPVTHSRSQGYDAGQYRY